jgi:hypothetical protein
MHASVDECSDGVAPGLIGSKHDEAKCRDVRDPGRVIGEDDRFERLRHPSALPEDTADLRSGMLVHIGGVETGPAVRHQPVEVRLRGEPVLPALYREVVATVLERLEGGLHVADVEVGLTDGEAHFR